MAKHKKNASKAEPKKATAEVPQPQAAEPAPEAPAEAGHVGPPAYTTE